MSIDPKNMGNLTGGIVAVELVNDNKIAKFRVAADYAGNDSKDPSNKTGYFNVTYFLNTDSPNAKFVASQLRDEKMKKGSQIQIAYRLVQDRWERDGKSGQGVTLIAEAITYAGGGGGNREGGGAPKGEATTNAPAPNEF